MCSGFTHQHTVEETRPRSQAVKASSSPLCDSIPLTKYITFGPFPVPHFPTILSYHCSSSRFPRGSHHASSLVSLMSFTCQKKQECSCKSQTKEWHTPVISGNDRRRLTVIRQEQRKPENMGGGVKEEILRYKGRETRRGNIVFRVLNKHKLCHS